MTGCGHAEAPAVDGGRQVGRVELLLDRSALARHVPSEDRGGGIDASDLPDELSQFDGHEGGLRLVSARQENALPQQTDRGDDVGDVGAGFRDRDVLRCLIHAAMIPKALLVHKVHLYNTAVRYIERQMPHRLTQARHSKSGLPCHHFDMHGVTCDEYDQMRERAAGSCEICRTPEPLTGGKRLVIDHFQAPRMWIVRGLLCDRCNSLMSKFDGTKNWGSDRAEREPLAAAYQERCWQQISQQERSRMESIQKIYREKRQ